MLTLKKPTIKQATAVRLADADTFAKCLKAQSQLHRLADVIDLPTVYALATQTLPDVTLPEAVTMLLRDVELAIESVTRYRGQFKATEDAEKLRLAPLRSGATRRLFAVISQLNSLDSSKRSHQNQYLERRKALEVAGLSKSEIDGLTPTYDAAAAQVEVDALTAEKNALEAFLKQSDESLLPVGFVPVPSIKNSPQPVHLEIPASARPVLRAELV